MQHTINTRWFQNALADKRLSQRGLASRLGVDPAAVSLMFRGKRKMSAADASAVAQFLNVSVDEVLGHAGITRAAPAKGNHQTRDATTDMGSIVHRKPESPLAPPTDLLDVPVPLSDGTLARLTLPRMLTKADAEKIAALVAAFAQG